MPGTTRVVRVQGNLQSNSSEVVRTAVLTGMGISYVPHWLLDTELASGEVQRLLPDWQPMSAPIQLVHPPERRHSAKVRAFGDHIARTLQLQDPDPAAALARRGA